MPAMLGINVAPDASPSALAAAGAKFVRCVYRSPDYLDLLPWCEALADWGIDVVLVGDSSPNSLGKNPGAWRDRMIAARNHLGHIVKRWQWGNEPDGTGIASWSMGHDQLNRLLVIARDVFPRGDFEIIGPGLVSGDTNWPAGMRLDLLDGLDGLDAHPYAKFIDNPASMADLNGMLDRYLAYGLPLWLGEYDSRTGGLSSYFRDYPGVARAAVMCWDDAQTLNSEGLALGLLQNTAAMADFKTAAQGQNNAPPVTQPKPPEYVLGFKDFHDAYPDLIGAPLENERGGIPGFSVQRSAHGRLMAQYMADPQTDNIRGWTITFWDDDGARWVYEGGRARQIA